MQADPNGLLAVVIQSLVDCIWPAALGFALVTIIITARERMRP